jgi:hypothetical protein
VYLVLSLLLQLTVVRVFTWVAVGLVLAALCMQQQCIHAFSTIQFMQAPLLLKLAQEALH